MSTSTYYELVLVMHTSLNPVVGGGIHYLLSASEFNVITPRNAAATLYKDYLKRSRSTGALEILEEVAPVPPEPIVPPFELFPPPPSLALDGQIPSPRVS